MDLEDQTVNNVLVKLRVLSGIRGGYRVFSSNGSLSVSPPSHTDWATRWWKGEDREKNLQDIESTLTDAYTKVKYLLDRVYTFIFKKMDFGEFNKNSLPSCSSEKSPDCCANFMDPLELKAFIHDMHASNGHAESENKKGVSIVSNKDYFIECINVEIPIDQLRRFLEVLKLCRGDSQDTSRDFHQERYCASPQAISSLSDRGLPALLVTYENDIYSKAKIQEMLAILSRHIKQIERLISFCDWNCNTLFKLTSNS